MSRVFTVSGTATGAKCLYVKHRRRAAPGARRGVADAGRGRASFYGAGDRSVQCRATLAWGKPGTWMFCFWLAADENTVATPSADRHLPRARRHDRRRRHPRSRGRASARRSRWRGRRVGAARLREDPLGRRPSVSAQLRCGPWRRIVGGGAFDGAFSIKANATEADPGTYLSACGRGRLRRQPSDGGVRQQTYAVVLPAEPAFLRSRSSIAGPASTSSHQSDATPRCACATPRRHRRPGTRVGGRTSLRATSCTRW